MSNQGGPEGLWLASERMSGSQRCFLRFFKAGGVTQGSRRHLLLLPLLEAESPASYGEARKHPSTAPTLSPPPGRTAEQDFPALRGPSREAMLGEDGEGVCWDGAEV